VFHKAIDLDPTNPLAYMRASGLFQLQGREDEAMAAFFKPDKSLRRHSAEQIRTLENAASTGGIRGCWRKRLEMLQDKARQSRLAPRFRLGVHPSWREGQSNGDG
jgi:hypothetical protein